MSNHLVKNKPEKEENIGTLYYRVIGRTVVGCGIVSLIILALVSTLPQDYEKYNVPLFFGIWFVISLIIIILGVSIIVLCKKSTKFQAWAEKDVVSYGQHLMDKEIQN